MKSSFDYFGQEHFGQTQNTYMTRPDASDVFREICSVYIVRIIIYIFIKYKSDLVKYKSVY